MNKKYINFYNNLILLTRNKTLYKDFTKQDTFSDRLVIFLFHFAFFLNVFKSKSNSKVLQVVFDYIFKQLEISIREIGYGDASINKKMKNYINVFHEMLSNINNWDSLGKTNKKNILFKYLDLNLDKDTKIVNYLDNYRNYLLNNTLNSLSKGVFKFNF